MDSLIKFENVYFHYPVHDDENDVQNIQKIKNVQNVLDGVNLTINQGEFVAIVGHNGSGKSTLAKHMNGIVEPSLGKVFVSGLDTSDEKLLIAIRKQIGMVFQNPDNQLVATIVEEDVAFALENLGVSPVEIRERVEKALEIVKMSQYRTHAPHRLSGGQKQRIAIAGVIAMSPKCIVLDEPTAMLDPIGRLDVMNTIENLNRQHGITIVLITHHMNEAAQAARMIVMEKGKIQLDGTPKQIFDEYDMLKKFGLNVPESRELTHQLGLDNLPALTNDECALSLYNWIV